MTRVVVQTVDEDRDVEEADHIQTDGCSLPILLVSGALLYLEPTSVVSSHNS